jgi:hypothetical protein
MSGLGRAGGIEFDPVGIGARAFHARLFAPIRELGKRPNLNVKLGGRGMRINGFGFEDAAEPPSSEMLAKAWKPYFETCIEAFGAGRCMFESNYPVDKGSYSYSVFWNSCKLIAKDASPAEKANLFAGTANLVYKLGLDLRVQFQTVHGINRHGKSSRQRTGDSQSASPPAEFSGRICRPSRGTADRRLLVIAWACFLRLGGILDQLQEPRCLPWIIGSHCLLAPSSMASTGSSR